VIAAMGLIVIATLATVPQPQPASKESAQPFVLKRSIALPGVSGRIDHMAYDPQTKRLFVAALENGSLEVVDLEKGERVKSIGGLKEPQGVVYIPSTRQVACSGGGDGTVRAFDAATLEEKIRVEVGDDADNMRLGPDGTSVQVGYGDGALAVLDAGSLKKTAEVKLPGHPEAFAPEPGSSRVFINVPGGALGGGGSVQVADLSTGKVITAWTLKEAGRNFPMALDAGHKRLYLGCRRSAKLLAIDTQNGQVVASPACVGDSDEVFVDPKSGRVLVVGGDGAIDVFETADQRSYTKAASVKTESGARTGLLVDERRALYVAVPRRSGHAAEIREYAITD